MRRHRRRCARRRETCEHQQGEGRSHAGPPPEGAVADLQALGYGQVQRSVTQPPSWQALQLVLPAFSLKVPWAHGVQLSPLPDTAEEDLGAHGEQLALVAAPGDGR